MWQMLNEYNIPALARSYAKCWREEQTAEHVGSCRIKPGCAEGEERRSRQIHLAGSYHTGTEKKRGPMA